jgi:FkbM family methyltransferase
VLVIVNPYGTTVSDLARGGFGYRGTLCVRSMSRLLHWASEVGIYWRECVRFGDFVGLMRVRLSQSKVGRWVTPRPITVRVDLRTLGPSVTIRSHSSDISVLKELLMGGSYEPLPEVPVDSVVDFGANIGLSFRWLRARYPGARFLCVEPEPGNLELLRTNVRAVDGRARIVAACVGGRERRVRLLGGRGEWGFRMTDERDVATQSAAVDVRTVPALLTEAGIDRIGVLKCDIEGAEAEVFEDCRSWIHRVDAMSVECHADSMSTEALLDALSANGGRFQVTHLERNPELGFDLVTLVRDGSRS